VQSDESLRCLIAAGGTAGHVLPALAIADALRARGVVVTFAGSPERAEARLVPDAGYELDTFRVVGLPRRPGLALGRALVLASRAVRECGRIIERRRPDVVLGGGGFVAGPMVVAAARRRIPTALTEADAHFGVANRLAAPFAQRVFLSFPIEGRDGAKYRVTGRPVHARAAPPARDEARRRLQLPREGPVLLVFGGSQGAQALNEFAVDAFGSNGPAVLHLAGERHVGSLRARVSRQDYRLFGYVEEFGAALAASDLALARAGGSVFELAAAGKPAVLVPYPHAAAAHQAGNARWMADGGAATVIADAQLDPRRLAAEVRALVSEPGRLDRMARAAHALARPDAADRIAEGVLALAR
jgi:UDP-N-acetylglucosamine--N-acetylmuramyl-(pentapeptide) pyrophosphoryl-undecaprenol N-acetylglucosamine transferase